MEVEKKYTEAVGTKFHSDGSVRYYPGNTIICFLNSSSTVFSEVLWAQNLLKETILHHKFTLLPPESFHMTVFELLCDQVRETEYWSRFLPLSASLAETDQFFKKQFAKITLPQNFEMRFDQIKLGPHFSIQLSPVNQAIEKKLWSLRECFSEMTGIRFQDFESYRFHLSLAYGMEEMNSEEKIIAEKIESKIRERFSRQFGTFHTGPPQLVFFHDMFSFLPSIER